MSWTFAGVGVFLVLLSCFCMSYCQDVKDVNSVKEMMKKKEKCEQQKQQLIKKIAKADKISKRQKKDEQQTPQKASPEEEMFSPNSVRRSQDENVSEMSPMRQSSDTASPDVFEDALSEPPAERNIM